MATAKVAIRGLTLIWQINADRLVVPAALAACLLAAAYLVTLLAGIAPQH